jgi:hypothetical protein
MKNKLTILTPLLHFSTIDRGYIETFFQSVSEQKDKNFKLSLIIRKEDKEAINNLNVYNLDISFFEEDIPKNETPSYASVVNKYIKLIDTEYFTVSLPTDVITDSYVVNFYKYVKYYSNINIFLPIVLEFDSSDNFIKMANEVIWNYNVTEQRGYFDFDFLSKNTYYSLVGAFFKTETFKKYLFKESIKTYFELEFLLRSLYRQEKVFVIPKFMVKHIISVNNIKIDSLDKMESLFYLETAKKEYVFDVDRKIEYKKE